MRTVDEKELQNSLSTYLACAGAGESIVIQSHNIPVAKLIPFSEAEDSMLDIPPELALSAADFTEEQLNLAAKGIITLPKRRIDWEALDKIPAPRVTGNAGTQAILDDRNESW